MAKRNVKRVEVLIHTPNKGFRKYRKSPKITKANYGELILTHDELMNAKHKRCWILWNNRPMNVAAFFNQQYIIVVRALQGKQLYYYIKNKK